MWETLLGGLVGGVFRIVPEVLKWLDRKDERKHELDMLDGEMRYAELRGRIEMGQAELALTGRELDAMAEAIKEQRQTARAAGKWVAAISALVRPLVTYWFVVLYSLVKTAHIINAFSRNADWKEALITTWSTDDMTIMFMILTFWFVGRVWERQSKSP